MCLGIPGRIVEIDTTDVVRMGRVAFGGIVKRVCLEHVSDAVVGDYVLVHVGFALSRISEEDAQRVFALLEELAQTDELDTPEIEPPARSEVLPAPAVASGGEGQS